MCCACAPTPIAVVWVLPCASRGGVGVPLPPWQLSHGWVDTTSTLPLMWSSGYEILPAAKAPGFIDGWHRPQSWFCGCGAGGGVPWHAPHWLWLPSTFVHIGWVIVPPAPGTIWLVAGSVWCSVSPWQ